MPSQQNPPARRATSLTARFALLLSLVGFVLAAIAAAGKAIAAPPLAVEKLADDVYALIGPTTDRDPVNLGNNANFGVIVTAEGVVLVDPGATRRGARMIHDAVRAITERPITLVINTGGQDHRWLGNGYFKSLGARVIANQKAVDDQRSRLHDQLARLETTVGAEGMTGTIAAYADETFADRRLLELGGTRIEIHHAGQAHTPGDSFVWLPAQRIAFSGDIVYVDRMLRVGSHSAHRSWIAAFEALAAKQPEIIVPGHGQVADLARAQRDTRDYLSFLRAAVGEFIDGGGGMEAIGEIDQSRFDYLRNYDALKGRNAQRVFEELEWE